MDFRIVAALSATAVAVPLSAGPASADPVLNGEFTVSGVGTNNQIAVGPDGNMWVTLESVTKDVAKITPDGTVTEYESANMSNPIGITAGPDGNLWVTQAGGVARFAPADPTTATPFAIAAIADPRAITTGPDGNLWTASADKAFKIPPANPGGFTPYPATGLSGARWITASSDGYLWVADFGVPQAVRIATDGTGTVFPALGGLQGIAGGAAGQVAYSQQGAAPYYVGVLTPPGPEKTALMPGADPFGVTYGADGAYWVARFATNNVARVTADAQSSTIALPANSGPRQIAAGPNDTVWVTLDNTDKIARITGVSAPVPTHPDTDANARHQPRHQDHQGPEEGGAHQEGACEGEGALHRYGWGHVPVQGRPQAEEAGIGEVAHVHLPQDRPTPQGQVHVPGAGRDLHGA
ncbi:MAG: hypothetical protein IPG68_15540 [Micrococcales bacterium]|nr:hypothetical protein [Micrococcales bacterium]